MSFAVCFVPPPSPCYSAQSDSYLIERNVTLQRCWVLSTLEGVFHIALNKLALLPSPRIVCHRTDRSRPLSLFSKIKSIKIRVSLKTAYLLKMGIGQIPETSYTDCIVTILVTIDRMLD
jgi:hypothetical protein